jgi:hypothetical protein
LRHGSILYIPPVCGMRMVRLTGRLNIVVMMVGVIS